MDQCDVLRKLKMADLRLQLDHVKTGEFKKVKNLVLSKKLGWFEAKIVERNEQSVPINFYLGTYESAGCATVAITVYSALIDDPILQTKLMYADESGDKEFDNILCWLKDAMEKQAPLITQIRGKRRNRNETNMFTMRHATCG